jgi:hypothetical protein
MSKVSNFSKLLKSFLILIVEKFGDKVKKEKKLSHNTKSFEEV